MLSSALISVALVGLAAASEYCPIKPYDARPGYDLACVYGNETSVYENLLVYDIPITGSMYSATVPFECIRQVNE
jgi:hypothetical protein